MAILPSRRKGPNAPRALTAAAVRLPTKDRSAIRKMARPAAEWQTDAWDYFDTNPEMKFAGWWAGNMLSKMTLFPAAMLPDGRVVAVDAIDPETIPRDTEGNPTGPGRRYTEDLLEQSLVDAAVAEWGRLHGEMGGQSELQRELAMNLDLAGECYLIGWAARDAVPANPMTGAAAREATAEVWEIRSVSEIVSVDGEWRVIDAPGSGLGTGRLIGDDDAIIRCYQRHPRWSSLPDCNTRAVLGECRLLQVLTGQMYAETMSRAAAGGFTVPTGLTITRADVAAVSEEAGPEAVSDGVPDGDAKTPFIDDLTEALTLPIADPSDPNSVVPFLIEGEKELLHPDVLRRVDFSRNTGAELDERINGRILRMAHGLNMPVEVLLGHRETTFTNAEQIDENEFVDHLEPRVLLQCDVLTIGFLRPQLADPDPVSGVARFRPEQIERIFTWYDATALVGEPDLSEDADLALDRFAVSREGYRKMKRIPDEYKPDAEEVLALLGLRRGMVTAEMTGAILQRLDAAFVPAPAGSMGGNGGSAAPAGDDDDMVDDAEGLMAAARATVVRQRMLAEIGSHLLGIDPVGLPALGMPTAARDPDGHPPLARQD